MSVLFITHDLAVVGEIADYVVVMRTRGDPRAGPAAQVFEAPQDAYTKALLKCRPQLDRRPAAAGDRRLHDGAAAPRDCRSASAASAARPIVLDVATSARASIRARACSASASSRR
jgi:peptide/nickel transport system ATP-binding protein